MAPSKHDRLSGSSGGTRTRRSIVTCIAVMIVIGLAVRSSSSDAREEKKVAVPALRHAVRTSLPLSKHTSGDVVASGPSESLASARRRVLLARRVAALQENARARSRPSHWALYTAARSGDAASTRRLLAAGADPNGVNNIGTTALHEAAREGHVEVVRALLAGGASVNLADYGGGTALLYAAGEGHTDIVKELLAAHADVAPAKTNDRGSALSRAARRGHVAVLRELVKAGADINHYDDNSRTPLFAAIEEMRPDVVDILLDAKADVNLPKRSDEETNLHLACARGNAPLARKLIAAGANVNATSRWDGRSGLMRAADAGNAEIVKALLDAGADINRSHNDGLTALSYAARGGRVDAVRELLKRGADRSVKDGWRHDGKTALEIATAAGFSQVVALFALPQEKL